MMNENFALCVYFMCAFLIFQSEKQICHNFICSVIGLSRIWWRAAFIIFGFSFRIFFFFTVCIFFWCLVGSGAQVVVRLMLINYMAAFKLKSGTTTQTNLIEKLLSPRFAYKSVSRPGTLRLAGWSSCWGKRQVASGKCAWQATALGSTNSICIHWQSRWYSHRLTVLTIRIA